MADEKKETAKKAASSSTKKSTKAKPTQFGPSQDDLNPAYAPPKGK